MWGTRPGCYPCRARLVAVWAGTFRGAHTHCPRSATARRGVAIERVVSCCTPCKKMGVKVFEPADATRSESNKYVGVNVAPFDGGEEWRPHGARTIGPLGRWTSFHAML